MRAARRWVVVCVALNFLTVAPARAETPLPIPVPVGPEVAVLLWPAMSFRTPAPVVGIGGPAALPNRYIVLFNPDTPSRLIDAVVATIGDRGGELHFRYAGILKGFAATLPAEVVGLLQNHPYTWFIEADQVIFGQDIQADAPWGLDRIDQRSLPLNTQYGYATTGAGVTAYVLDTGIRASHTQFEDRVVYGASAIDDGLGSDDCNGHGTHVAGTIAGNTYGVAKQVELVAVRVLDCNNAGAASGLVAGIEWVTANHTSPAVANMSVGTAASDAVDEALRQSIASGVTYITAAGNNAVDACGMSPARVPAAVTVGATSTTDARASFSNWGTCLDLFAPGEDIESSWNTSDTDAALVSGTSMAAPHVTGVAALILQRTPAATPAQVHAALVDGATTGLVTDPAGSPNRLLFSPN